MTIRLTILNIMTGYLKLIKGERITLQNIILDREASQYYRILMLNSPANEFEATQIISRCHHFMTNEIAIHAAKLRINGFPLETIVGVLITLFE